jgi:type IV secretory pathway component VirB8
MARKDHRTGKFIISAGEVGSYTVCPESWRLQYVEKVNSDKSELSIEGDKLHEDWAARYEKAHNLAWQAKLTILLLMLAVVIVILMLLK